MMQRLRLIVTLFCAEAMRALLRNSLRSALAGLGVAIGIAAVVCVVALGQAGSEQAEQQLEALGNNLVWIEEGNRNINGVRTGSHGAHTLTLADAEAIRREIPLIRSVSPQVDGAVQAVAEARNWSTHYRGVSIEFMEIRRWDIASGVVFSEDEVARGANVCLLGQTVREQLFGHDDPLGRSMRLGAIPFRVIGVLAIKGQSAAGSDQDDTVIIPYTTARKLRGGTVPWLDDVMGSAATRGDVNRAIAAVEGLLRQRHHIRPGMDDDFNIRRPDEVIRAQNEASNTLALLLLSVATISLLVGAVGVMNVMLVSVTERTREIGLRLALGATGSEVLVQFLGEAIFLCLGGGVAGVALGVGASFALGRGLAWPIVISPTALVVAPLFSGAVGVVSGFYPARKAAAMDPIEALRRE